MSNITVNSQFIRANFMQAIKDGHVHAFFQPIMMNISYSRERIAREDAGIIADFYHFFGRQPISPEEATDWYRNSLAD